MKKIILALIVLSFVLVACSTTLTRTITTPEGIYSYEETATTSMRPVIVGSNGSISARYPSKKTSTYCGSTRRISCRVRLRANCRRFRSSGRYLQRFRR